MCNIIKQWIAYILNLQQAFIVTYEKSGKKYLRIVRVRNRKKEEFNFLVEHLLDENLNVTEEILQKEEDMFSKL